MRGAHRLRRRRAARRASTSTATSTPAPMRHWGPTVANRVPVHASGPYLVPHYRARARADPHPRPGRRRLPRLRRAAGGDRAGDALRRAGRQARHRPAGVPPAERASRRRRHRHRPGARSGRRHRRLPRGAAAALGARAAPRPSAFNRAANGRVRRGVGVACMWYGCGNTSLPNPSTIRVGICGRRRAWCCTRARSISARARTRSSPRSAPMRSACRSTPSTLIGADTELTPTPARPRPRARPSSPARRPSSAGRALRAAILRLANAGADARARASTGRRRSSRGRRARAASTSPRLPADADGYVFAAEETFDPPTTPLDANGQGMPYAVYGFGAQMAELEVDIELGTVQARCKITAAHDVGRAINPTARRGPDRGRHRAGHRHGADGGVHPRPHREPARLPDPDHRRRAADRDDPDRGARPARARSAPRASASRC